MKSTNQFHEFCKVQDNLNVAVALLARSAGLTVTLIMNTPIQKASCSRETLVSRYGDFVSASTRLWEFGISIKSFVVEDLVVVYVHAINIKRNLEEQC